MISLVKESQFLFSNCLLITRSSKRKLLYKLPTVEVQRSEKSTRHPILLFLNKLHFILKSLQFRNTIYLNRPF